jgi:hypothetical protein
MIILIMCIDMSEVDSAMFHPIPTQFHLSVYLFESILVNTCNIL